MLAAKSATFPQDIAMAPERWGAYRMQPFIGGCYRRAAGLKFIALRVRVVIAKLAADVGHESISGG